MEKNIKLINLTLTLVCIVTIIMSLILFQPNKNTNVILQNKIDSLKFYHGIFKNMSFLRQMEITSEGYKISSELKITNENGIQSFLKDIIKQPTLIYRFSSSNCTICVEEQFAMLKEMQNYLPEHIILLGSYLSYKNLNIIKRTQQFHFKVYNVMELDIPMENQSNPYYFVINPDMTCNHFFSAMKETPFFTQKYLSSIGCKLTKKMIEDDY